jgi:hypothetical protein
MSSVEGADDIGDDIELGNWNHCSSGTMFELDLEDGANAFSDTQVMSVFPQPLGQAGFPVHGIVASGTLGGSAIVGTLVGIGDGAAIIGQGMSLTNPGVLGTNDLGPGVSGISNAPAGIGVLGQADKGSGIGVFGESSSSFGTGVLGNCNSGTGVSGASGSGTGVSGFSSSGYAVTATSGGIALVAASGSDRGGVFLSGSVGAGPASRTSQGGIAQLRLVPAKDAKLPTKAHIGDLYAHLTKFVSLYLCVNDSPVQWQQLQLGTTTYAGGQSAP